MNRRMYVDYWTDGPSPLFRWTLNLAWALAALMFLLKGC